MATNNHLLVIDDVESKNETRAWLQAASHLNIETHLVTNDPTHRDDPVCHLASSVYYFDSQEHLDGVVSHIFHLNEIAHIVTTTDIFVPYVNDLALRYKLKYPIAASTDDIFNLVDKFEINNFTIPKTCDFVNPIPTKVITGYEGFESLYSEYQGPVFSKINWGFSWGRSPRPYGGKFQSILHFKRFLQSNGLMDQFLEDSYCGIKLPGGFGHKEVPFKYVIQKFIPHNKGWGPYALTYCNRLQGDHNYYSAANKYSNTSLGPQELNVKPRFPDLEEGNVDFRKLISKLHTTFSNCEIIKDYRDGKTYLSDINVRIGGSPSLLTDRTTGYPDCEKALRPFTWYLRRIFFEDYSQERFDTLDCQKIVISKINVSVSEKQSNESIHKILNCFVSEDFRAAKVDLLEQLLKTKSEFKTTVDLIFNKPKYEVLDIREKLQANVNALTF